jgi:hypothetical protein
MSRSKRKTPKIGITKAESEKQISLADIEDKIEIVDVSPLMDGGTIVLSCKYDNEYFQIRLNQRSQQSQEDEPGALYFNNALIRAKSNDENKIIELLNSAINTADQFPRVPKILKSIFWTKKNKAYWINRFSRDVIKFIQSEKYLKLAKQRDR